MRFGSRALKPGTCFFSGRFLARDGESTQGGWTHRTLTLTLDQTQTLTQTQTRTHPNLPLTLTPTLTLTRTLTLTLILHIGLRRGGWTHRTLTLTPTLTLTRTLTLTPTLHKGLRRAERPTGGTGRDTGIAYIAGRVGVPATALAEVAALHVELFDQGGGLNYHDSLLNLPATEAVRRVRVGGRFGVRVRARVVRALLHGLRWT